MSDDQEYQETNDEIIYEDYGDGNGPYKGPLSPLYGTQIWEQQQQNPGPNQIKDNDNRLEGKPNEDKKSTQVPSDSKSKKSEDVESGQVPGGSKTETKEPGLSNKEIIMKHKGNGEEDDDPLESQLEKNIRLEPVFPSRDFVSDVVYPIPGIPKRVGCVGCMMGTCECYKDLYKPDYTDGPPIIRDYTKVNFDELDNTEDSDTVESDGNSAQNKQNTN